VLLPIDAPLLGSLGLIGYTVERVLEDVEVLVS
jgi:hypothetical protein